MDQEISALVKTYSSKKNEIIARLKYFRKSWNKSNKEIFSELCFCILTPQSNAIACDEIICTLKSSGLLFCGNIDQIKPHLKKARFYRNKAKYIFEAREFLIENGNVRIKNRLDIDNIMKTRDWLAKNIKGIGYKEASHFLRNIGFGENIAILDIHILRNLKKYGILEDVPASLTNKKYLEIENKLRKFSEKISIPMSHLDLLFWSLETNKIFK